MTSTVVDRLRRRPWGGVVAGAGVVFCLALAYVAGRLEGAPAPAADGAVGVGTQAEQPAAAEDLDEGFGDGFRAPPDADEQSGEEPPITQAS